MSYSITFTARLKNQKALISVGKVSSGSGANSASQNKQSSSFAGTIPTTVGAQALSVTLSQFGYTDKATAGTFIYDVSLTVTFGVGSPITADPSTLTVTF